MHRILNVLLLLTGAHIANAWTNGQLLIWMDADRAAAMQLVANKFEQDYGIPVRIETPEKITDSFPLAAQAGKGPDIVVWAHDKVGEWADGGVIAPIEVTAAYKQQFYPMAWDAVLHRRQLWGYPISPRSDWLDLQQKTGERRTSHSTLRSDPFSPETQVRAPGHECHSLGLQQSLLFLGHHGERWRLYLRQNSR